MTKQWVFQQYKTMLGEFLLHKQWVMCWIICMQEYPVFYILHC